VASLFEKIAPASMKNKNKRAQPIDVLLLHGKDLSLVASFADLLTSLGLTTAKVIDLPSLGMDVDNRVDAYIKASRLKIAIASFDEDHKRATKSRPNVYDEITRCLKLSSRNDLIVLRETRAGTDVQLPSNVESKLGAIIPFERGRLELAIPKLIRDIISRGLPKHLRKQTDSDRTSTAILVLFMRKMDKLWDDFTEAWNKVHASDADAESKLTIFLDKFFQKYHGVLKARIVNGKKGEELKVLCEEAFEKSLNYLAQSWVAVVESKHREADKLNKTDKALRHGKVYEDVIHKYRRIEKVDADALRISRAKEVLNQFEKYITKAS
jgi:hypothetical protein